VARIPHANELGGQPNLLVMFLHYTDNPVITNPIHYIPTYNVDTQ